MYLDLGCVVSMPQGLNDIVTAGSCSPEVRITQCLGV